MVLRQSGDVSKHLNTTKVIVITVMIKMVKVNLDIEEGLHKTIRKEAIDRGITMKAYLLELIEAGVKAKEAEVSEEGEEANAAKK
jgi:hypothetical protein